MKKALFVVLVVITIGYFTNKYYTKYKRESEAKAYLSELLFVPEGFEPVYKIDTIYDLSGFDATRLSCIITIQDSIPEDELKMNVVHVIRNLYNTRNDAKAINVKVFYRDNNTSMAVADFAPCGSWSNATDPRYGINDYDISFHLINK